jgi:hypothetical protein
MARLHDIIAYLLQKYPYKNELSTARLTKMIYLSDWKAALDSGEQLTDIQWFFDNYGPFVWDVTREAGAHPRLFNIEDTENMYGDRKRLFRLLDGDYTPDLSSQDKQVLDHVISATEDLNWDQFIKLVYSTYPVISSDRYTTLDLAAKASEYKEESIG